MQSTSNGDLGNHYYVRYDYDPVAVTVVESRDSDSGQ